MGRELGAQIQMLFIAEYVGISKYPSSGNRLCMLPFSQQGKLNSSTGGITQ